MNPTIPVYGQYPGNTKTRRLLGEAPDNFTVKEVAAKFKIKPSDIVTGYIYKSRTGPIKGRYWILVSLAFGDEV